MSAAQIHLALLHFPIAGVFLGLLFLVIGAVISVSWLKKSGLLLFVLAGLLSVPVFLSGEGAEEIVEDKPNVTGHLIHEHEEAAELAFYVGLGLAAVGLGALLLDRKNPRLAGKLTFVAFVVGIGSAALFARAAHLGGMIRHDELRPVDATEGASPEGGENETERGTDNDHDE